jgi:hypothetical protein
MNSLDAGYLTGIWYFGLFFLYVITIVVPCWRIVKRAGFNGAWSLVALVPLFNVIFLWVFSLLRWPNERTNS